MKNGNAQVIIGNGNAVVEANGANGVEVMGNGVDVVEEPELL